MKSFTIIFAVIFSVLTVTPFSYVLAQKAGVEDEAQARAARGGQGDSQPPSREEMIDELNDMLSGRDDIRDLIPGMAVWEDAGGEYLEYNGSRLEELDENVLEELTDRVNNLLVTKNLENIQRIQQQNLEMRRIQDISRQQRMQQQLRQLNLQKPPQPPPQPSRTNR